MAEEKQPENPRQACGVCLERDVKAIYRYPEDFDEHLRLHVKEVEDNSNRPTFSDKDTEGELDLDGLADSDSE